MKNKEITIKHEVYVPNKTFEELKESISNKDILRIGEDLSEMLKVKNAIQENTEEIVKKADEIIKENKEYLKKINDYIDKELKPILIDYADKTKIVETKQKLNEKTMDLETISNVIYNLPDGITAKQKADTYEYNEDLIDDKYFKKTLNKTSAKKAWQAGELNKDAITKKSHGLTISITPAKVIESAENEK